MLRLVHYQRVWLSSCVKLIQTRISNKFADLIFSPIQTHLTYSDTKISPPSHWFAKPFHADELRLQSKNLLTTRNNQQRKYQQITLQYQPVKTADNPEQRFLKKVILAIEKYIDDENLNVNRLSELLYMSNSQLYRKIQALTNYTVTQFIRNIRLAKAKAMLENGEGNVSEVAFNVGLTPSYFSRCFTKVYGFPPRELIKW